MKSFSKKPYTKPKINSSRIKAISFYGRDSLRSAGYSEILIAGVATDPTP